MNQQIRPINKDERRQQIASILSNICGMKNATSINSRRKKVIMGHMQDKTGTDKYVRQALRSGCRVKRGAPLHDDEDTRTRGQLRSTQTHTMTPFTMQELENAINQLKRGKVADTKGFNAGTIQRSTRRVHTHSYYDCATKSSNNIRRTATKLAGYNDQSHFYER